jgi:hypothetical protein
LIWKRFCFQSLPQETTHTRAKQSKNIMADEDDGPSRLTHAQVIRSSLVSVSASDTIDQDLEYSAEVLRRAVQKIKQFDRVINLDEVAEQEKLKAILALNAMYALEKKFDAKGDDRNAGGRLDDSEEY